MGILATEDREAVVGDRILITDVRGTEDGNGEVRLKVGDVCVVVAVTGWQVEIHPERRGIIDKGRLFIHFDNYEVIVFDTLSERHRNERIRAAKESKEMMAKASAGMRP